MKNLNTYMTESQSILTKEEIRKDYDKIDFCESMKEKLEYASKYGVDSKKKDEIRYAMLLKLRELRKNASQFDEEDWHDFYRLLPDSLSKLPEYLKEENPKFVTWIQQYYLEHRMKGKLKNWIGMNPGRDANYYLSYADIHTIKFYNKILEFIASNTPKTRTAKDDIFDFLVNKFSELLEDYKKEYLKKVAAFASLKYKSIPDDIDSLKEKLDECKKRLDALDWRKERNKWSEEIKLKDKLNTKIDKLENLLKKYTEKQYIDKCVEQATEDFENNIKVLASKIQEEELEVDKLEVKSVKDDPKVFKMKITDGTKNLYCRSILAAEFSNVMIPHYRFIITNRSKDDSNYKD